MVPEEVIALDVGERRIGLARANSVARLPEPLAAIDRKVLDSTHKIAEMLNGLTPSLVLVGLPKNLKGDVTEQTGKSQAFSEEISGWLEVPVKLIDETLSTVESSKWQSRYPDADEDSLAACIILERYFTEKW